MTAAAEERWFTRGIPRAPSGARAAAHGRAAGQRSRPSYAAAYTVFATSDLGDRLGEIRHPTLVATGENDVGSNTRMARMMHERIKGSRLEILPQPAPFGAGRGAGEDRRAADRAFRNSAGLPARPLARSSHGDGRRSIVTRMSPADKPVDPFQRARHAGAGRHGVPTGRHAQLLARLGLFRYVHSGFCILYDLSRKI